MLDGCGRLVRVFLQAEDGIRDLTVTGVQTCALPISLHSFPKNRGKNRRTRHCKYQQRGQPQFPAPPCRCCCEFRHGNAPLGKAMAYSGLNAATPRAMASATPGTTWSSSARSFTTTLETSTAIAGAAVVRSCRMAAVCAASGEIGRAH